MSTSRTEALFGICQPLAGVSLRHLARDALFFSLWLFVLFVSVVDGMLTVVHQDEMMQAEINPVGRALLHLHAGDIGYLMIAKTLGTILAASIVLVIYWRIQRMGLLVVTGLACFQLALLLFLSLM